MHLPLTRRRLLTAAAAALALPAAAQTTPKPPTLPEILARIDRRRLLDGVATLANFPTRWSLAEGFPAVEAYMVQAFAEAGASATRQSYRHPQAGERHNILAGDPRDPRGVILIGAHFDSISESPQTNAPGANDNASGVAALIEACRVLQGVPLRKSLVFVAFSGEEQELQGSQACARIAAREGWPIELMLNLDMLGRHPDGPGDPLYIEYDQGNAVAANDAPAARFGQQAARLAAAFTDLSVAHTDIWDSDYMPFEAQGYPCIGLYDGGVETREYHSTADVPEAMDFDRLAQVTRLVVAIIATSAGLA